MNPGRLDEHPMPETTSTSWGGMPSSTMASFSDLRTPKSPHPGHQSGSTGPSRLLSVSSTVAIDRVPFLMHALGRDAVAICARRQPHARLEDRARRLAEEARRRRVPPVAGSRGGADDEHALGAAVGAVHQL